MAGLVDPLVEHDLAVVLGVPPDRAPAVIAALAEAGLLQHGIVVVAAVLAARTGVELTDAARALGSGSPLPQGVSEYELRTAAEEAEADLDDLWDTLTSAPAGPTSTAWRRLKRTPANLTDSDAVSKLELPMAPPTASAIHIAPPSGRPAEATGGDLAEG